MTWPCPACGALDIVEGATLCLDETSHSDCAHDATTTPCPNDEEFDD